MSVATWLLDAVLVSLLVWKKRRSLIRLRTPKKVRELTLVVVGVIL